MRLKPTEPNAVREYVLVTEVGVDCNSLPSVCVYFYKQERDIKIQINQHKNR